MALIKMTVNGQAVEHDVPDNTLLVSFIRETLELTGTHVGCDTSPVSYTHLTLPTTLVV